MTLQWRVVMKASILAVDSEPDLLVTYYRLLTREGYRVVTAPSRTGGLLALDRERPDLVIVTLSLRDGNGLDVIRAARELEVPAAAILVSRFRKWCALLCRSRRDRYRPPLAHRDPWLWGLAGGDYALCLHRIAALVRGLCQLPAANDGAPNSTGPRLRGRGVASRRLAGGLCFSTV
jgi:response regulator receiver domain-containing protein